MPKVRRFELRQGPAPRFWEIGLDGLTLVVRFGRIGGDATTQKKSFRSQDAADADIDRQVGSKLASGWVEATTPAAAAPGGSEAAPEPAPARARPARAPAPPVRARQGKAVGLSHVKPAFCFTPEHDALFALGWPHLVRLEDGLAEDEDPVQSALEILSAAWPRISWPRATAARLVRYHRLPQAAAWGPDKKGRGGPTKAALALMEQDAPLDADDARAVIDCQLGADRARASAESVVMLLRILDAAVGSLVVADLLTERLEQLPEERLAADDWLDADTTRELGFLLLRVDAKAAASLRKRLEKVFARAPDAPAGEHGSVRTSLDLVLHGAEGVRRSALGAAEGFASPSELVFVQDDPKFVRQMLQRWDEGPESPDPRLTFLGGEQVLDIEASWLRGYDDPEEAYPFFVEAFGPIRSKRLLPIFLALSATFEAREPATQWFIDHLDFARPYLEEHAGGRDKEARWARAVLAAAASATSRSRASRD
jgi:predicted DNA-binding WGR domain protein